MSYDSLILGVDELSPAMISKALQLRSTLPEELYQRQLQDISSETNQAIFYLAAREWPPALIADKLALEEHYVTIVINSNINKARIHQLAAEVPEDDPLSFRNDETKFYSAVAVLSRQRLIALIQSKNEYVAATMIKEVNNRAYGKPKEHVRVTHEHSLAGMMKDLRQRENLIEEEVIDV